MTVSNSTNSTLHSSNAAAIASALWDSADFSGALAHYERALRENPSDMEALHGMGRLKLAHNELAAAVLCLEQAYGLSLSLASGKQLSQRICRELAWAYYRLDRFDLAAQYFALLPQQDVLVAQLQAFGDRTPYRFSADLEEIALPFLGTDPLPIVTVVVGGKEHAFVIDSGSAQLVIDSQFLRELALPSYGIQDVRFASGQKAAVSYTILPSIMLGEAVIRDVPAEVMDIRRFAPQISGFIGTSFLQHFHILYDFGGQVLRLRPKRQSPFTQFGKMTTVPFMLFDGHLMLTHAKINQHETMAYIASGMAGGAFTVPDSTVQQAVLTSDDKTLDGVSAGGTSSLMMVRAETLSLGEFCRHDIDGFAGFFPAELEWRYGFRVGALVSHAFLKQNFWGIDFKTMKMYFN